ncbi:MAG: hypothetical protein J2P27_03630 [Actinobacteria bacterium]|nr:hypothetical protein [Actinomycetota bacterium]
MEQEVRPVNLGGNPALALGLAGVVSAVAMLGRQMIAARTLRAHDRERRETIVSAVREAARHAPAGGGAVIIVCTSSVPAGSACGPAGRPPESPSCLND